MTAIATNGLGRIDRAFLKVAMARQELRVVAVNNLIGASIGVVARERLPLRPLTVAVCAYLGAIGLWMLYESFTLAEHVLVDPIGITRVVPAAIMAFVIAVISGGLGVAGGEMRIPALLYLFAVPIQTARIISLMVSVPTLVGGPFTDRRIGGLPNAAARIAALMGIASAIGGDPRDRLTAVCQPELD